MDGLYKDKKTGMKPFRKMNSINAAAILREQQLESDLEQLWMDGPSIVNEEEPRRKRFLY